MAHYQATFRVAYDSPYARFTAEHPDTTISQWCNWDRDYIEISRPSQIDRRIHDDVYRMAKELKVQITRKSKAPNSMGISFDSCLCNKVSSPPLMEMDRFNCLSLQPYVFEHGSELCCVVALSQADLKNLLSSLERHGKVEMVSKNRVEGDFVRDRLALSLADVLGGLTAKQRFALRAALELGYYQKPRRADASDVARALGVPRTSFVDHVRKAENKILASLRPYISLES